MKPIHSLLAASPFRMLGIWSNGSVREITSNAGRIKAFAKVHKKASFKSDLENFLGVIERSEEELIKAQTAIHLPADRLKAVLFWFVKSDNIDPEKRKMLTENRLLTTC